MALSASDWLLLGEALLVLTAASMAIALLPFRRTAELMRVNGPQRSIAPALRDRIVARCRWAVHAWSRRVPWRAVCFQRGLTLHLMLRRRGICSELHYGVAQGEAEGLRAHVWVSVASQTVIGGEEAPKFTRLASFPQAKQD
jgi:hypothetical protein